MYKAFIRKVDENRWGVYAIDGRLLLWTCSENQARLFSEQILSQPNTRTAA